MLKERSGWVIETAVAQALKEKKPVVALESTLITHGLPYPDNMSVAQGLEAAVRAENAVPATIAVLNGNVHIGLSEAQLHEIATGENMRKCSRRDLPIVVGRKMSGGTTVAGTMVLAEQMGIELFATGGIGGVHRDSTFDISADLIELGRIPMTVVCSGAKSILDLVATREMLETEGVTVVGYQTDEMPAFFTRHSGILVDISVNTPREVAELIMARRSLGLRQALLVTVPVPVASEMIGLESEEATKQAQAEAMQAGVVGAALTPWLLRRLWELTEGRSIVANRALLDNNAHVAGAIARALSELELSL